MKFEEALKALRDGKGIRKECWDYFLYRPAASLSDEQLNKLDINYTDIKSRKINRFDYKPLRLEEIPKIEEISWREMLQNDWMIIEKW